MLSMSEDRPADRKQDHIDLAFKANMAHKGTDERFYYEPAISGHPTADLDIGIDFLGKRLKAPIWVSSMTGGTEKALTINKRLAETCAKYGLGMGLGSCRPLLDSLDRLQDFDLRGIIGPNLPLYANLGIAQVEYLLSHGRTHDIVELVDRLKADGLIVHINPLQEWLQPEGDYIIDPPMDTIQRLLDFTDLSVIVKEVGQGMGPESIQAIVGLPIAAFEFAAHGGTNFSRLELLRADEEKRNIFDAVSTLGHTIGEMSVWINGFALMGDKGLQCRQFIISGGVRDFLDGYYWINKLQYPAIYGQASGFLRYATESQEALDQYVAQQIRGLQMAQTYLRVR